MALSLEFVTLDVFTHSPFKGNQLAIVHLPHDSTLSQSTKQAIAREYNFSETVFLYAAAPDVEERRLDIFTITQELHFAGHPTIGTICHVCQSTGSSQVKLRTKAGLVTGKYDRSSGTGEAMIPHNVRIHKMGVPRKAVLASQQGLSSSIIPGPDLPLVSIVKGTSFTLVQLPDISQALGSLKAENQKIDQAEVRYDEGWQESFTGVFYYVVVSRGEITKLRVRMMEPSIGEDAATGSAACTLAAFLTLKDGQAGGCYTYEIEQGIEMGRASTISVSVDLSTNGTEIHRMKLAGSAVLVMEGKIHVPLT